MLLLSHVKFKNCPLRVDPLLSNIRKVCGISIRDVYLSSPLVTTIGILAIYL